ncbi:MAG: SRPBCC domain-containing protein, partial [Actinomycetota bacterium]|nr:SRPBCC domain-containing protein [Actinomycetota bacterium]
MSTSTETAVTTQVYRVYIKATPEAIWDAITKPEWTERYGYGGRAEFEPDLRPGATYRGMTSEAMRSMGAPDVGVDGEILEVDPPHRLVQTWRMVMDDDMTAEGFTRLTYEIAEGKGGVSKLTLIHELEGKPKLAVLMSGGMEDTGAGGGWSWVLSDL